MVVLITLGYAQIWLLKIDHDITTKRKQVVVKNNKQYPSKKVLTQRKCFRQTIAEYLIAVLISRHILWVIAEKHIDYKGKYQNIDVL